MWAPDVRTIFLLIFLTNGFLTLMILAYWKTQKTYDGFAIWALSLLFQSLAYLLFFLRGEVPDILTIPGANTLSICAMVMRIDAIRRFIWNRRLPAGYYFILLPIFIAYCGFTFFIDSILLRAIISTLFISPVLIIAGILAVSSRERENRIIRHLFAATLISPALVMLVRMMVWVVIKNEYTLFSTDIFNTAFFLVAIIADILSTGFFLMLNMVRSQKELRQTNEKLNLLSGITRHDIRNQLHALSGFLELSRQTTGEPELAAELIAKEERIAETITHQINFTRDYEELGIKAPAWQNVDRIVRQSAAALPMRDVRVDVDRPELEIYADPLLAKVFYNLMDNALRYGGPAMTKITITSHEKETGLSLVFEDNGTGIPVEYKKHLFERGYGKNSGLGLFLSREILAITGISITETSEPGRGARFEISIPGDAYRFVKRGPENTATPSVW